MKPIDIANKILFPSLLFLSALVSHSAFAFSDLDGKADSISKYIGQGKWTVIEVWSTHCPTCRAHMPEMVKFDGTLKNTRLLGIALDGKDAKDDVDDFIIEYNMDFANIISNFVEMNTWMKNNTGQRLMGTPTFVIYNPQGRLVAAKAGLVSTAALSDFIKKNSEPKPSVK